MSDARGEAAGRSGVRHLVTVVIPCRNERGFINRCLDSVLATEYPIRDLEVIVVDGISDDGTRDILRDYEAAYDCVSVIDNPDRIVPKALNLGISKSRGSVIVRIDVHADYPPTYIPNLVSWLETSGADNVGGIAITLPASDTLVARAIARGLSHPFGVGNSHFRIGIGEPRWVDTVPFGCFRRELFERIGGFDEALVRNQDDEFNARLTQSGGRILLVPEITFRYYARGTLGKLWHMYYQYGYFKPLGIYKLGTVPTVRQIVPGAFVSIVLMTAVLSPWWAPALGLLLATVSIYLASVLLCSVFVGFRERELASLLLPLVFPTIHWAYGVGFLVGGARFLLFSRGRAAFGRAIPISR
jgi:glycosyltransferase involved in cell wall biosynthesis